MLGCRYDIFEYSHAPVRCKLAALLYKFCARVSQGGFLPQSRRGENISFLAATRR
jgi:hypothetical protein